MVTIPLRVRQLLVLNAQLATTAQVVYKLLAQPAKVALRDHHHLPHAQQARTAQD